MELQGLSDDTVLMMRCGAACQAGEARAFAAAARREAASPQSVAAVDPDGAETCERHD
jgi:hypothetical protein